MIHALRRSLLSSGVAGLIAVAALFAGCSRTGSPETAAAATSGEGPVTIGIETSSMFVTVANRAGSPIVNVRIAIRPVGGPLTFTSTLQRLENGEKRDISLNSFRSNDGTTFSPRIYKPKQVTVTATDIVGKGHERTVPWAR